MPSDTTDLRDECARLMGWVHDPSFDESAREYPWTHPDGRHSFLHPVPDTLDAAVAIIEDGGWKWERRVNGASGTITIWSPNFAVPVIDITETGDRNRDFFAAAVAKLRAQQGGQHGQV